MDNSKKISLYNFLMIILKPFWIYVFALFIVSVIWAVDTSFSPYLIKIIVDRLELTNRMNVINDLMNPIWVYMGWFFFVLCVYRLYDMTMIKMMPKLRQSISIFFMDRMMEHSHRYFQQNFAGSISNRIRDVVAGVPLIVELAIDRLLGTLLIVLVAVSTLFTLHDTLAYAFLIWVTFFLGVSFYFLPRMHTYAHNAAETRSQITGHLVDVLSNMMAVRLFTGRFSESRRFSHLTNEGVTNEQTLEKLFFKIYIFQGFSFFAYEGFCFWFLIHDFQRGLSSAGDFAMIFGMNISIIQALWNLGKDFSQFADEWGKVSQGLSLINNDLDIIDDEDAQPLTIKEGKITFENVNFYFEDGKHFFNNLNLTIPGGQKVGFVGYSGSGKSTFCYLILRLFDIQNGSIKIDDFDISNVSQESLHKSVSFIPQDTHLFHRTIIENIRYGKMDATDEEIVEASKQAHAHDFIQHLYAQYNTPVGDRGTKLSGGQRQRLSIARAFLKHAPILILDEATSALDSLTEEHIQDSLLTLMKDKTTLVIAHRLSTLLHMDRILVFNDGQIVQDGSHAALIAQDGLYKSMWEAQVEGFLPDKTIKKKS
jgi:ATP-binding cassette subfamily B protein